MYDIAIVGAGPAGATLARLVGYRYKVLLLDKRQLTGDTSGSFIRAKCCGGLLAPDAQKMLSVLGLGLPQDVLTGPQLFAVRTIDLQTSVERHYQRFYINIDRGKFDRWLVSLIPAGIDLRFGSSFKSFERKDGAFELKITQNGKEFVETAKILIGADGAFSAVRRQALPERPLPKRYIAVQEWYEVDELLPYYTTIFDNEVTDFYSWTIPKENYLIIGSALSPQNQPINKFKLLKKKLRKYGFQFDRPVKKEGAYLLRPVSARQICLGKNGIALLGESAGWISPSSAEGLSYSFRSALLLAQSLQDGTEDFLQRYHRSAGNLHRNIVLKNWKSFFMYSPFLRKLLMSSGVQSVKIYK